MLINGILLYCTSWICYELHKLGLNSVDCVVYGYMPALDKTYLENWQTSYLA